jgi:formylglycine-generating enzyme
MMGSDRHYADEAPVHCVTIGPFWTDIAPVTNREFHRSVAETGYVTFAGIPSNPNDYPGALPNLLKAGAMIFNPSKHAVDTHNSTTNVGFRCIVRRAGGRLDRVSRGAVLRERAA